MSAKRSNLPSFMATQAAFTAYIRDPENTPLPPDCDPRRMRIYRELFYNNMEGMVARTFPVLKALVGDAAWHEQFQQFFAGHLCQSPYFREIPEEFFTWLQQQTLPEAMPWLLELAHYEWVELVLEVSDEEPEFADTFTLAAPLQLSPLALPLAYTWPVHHLSKDYQPTQPPQGMTFLLVWRDEVSRVRFMELAPDVARLLQLIALSDGAITGLEAIMQVVGEFGRATAEGTLKEALSALHVKGIIGIPA